jgi:hypothetical protein
VHSGFKPGACGADDRGMGGGEHFRHSCAFCGWARASATPVMLSPWCEHCGCALDALPAVGGEVGGASTTGGSAARWWSSRPARRVATAFLALLMLYAAAKLGYEAGGASGAMIAFGGAAFLLLPFVPERVGAAAARR